ncbi:hypothetical protein [Mycoplasmopsis pulmonis]|uniref:hypothetical protein n=1 Tax=Mycoplasmopsis pulmonis TaxID=2107 RepID=UPI00059C91CB|nr:hypothetical protein [Mycoplasmopsis pulmonis]MDZ7293467.1 hypothetical protein [Mycoplasmopsis pulmonis]
MLIDNIDSLDSTYQYLLSKFSIIANLEAEKFCTSKIIFNLIVKVMMHTKIKLLKTTKKI